jgi:CubicO group peptidase (beta-lactamase class C family)
MRNARRRGISERTIPDRTRVWRTTRRLVGLAIAGFLMAGCLPPGRAEADRGMMVALSPLDSVITQLREEERLPALAAAVVRGDSIIAYGASGVRVLVRPDTVQWDDRFHIASLAKPMAATVIARLVEGGRLSWGTTPADVFPEAEASMHPALRGVTVEQLLSHRAGLAPFTTSAEWQEIRAQDATGMSPAGLRRRLALWVLARAPADAPGTAYRYSNVGYGVVSAMAERVTGQPWESLIQELLWRPLGMTSAGFGWPAATHPSSPWGHERLDSLTLRPHDPLGPFQLGSMQRPNGDVHMNILDLARFARLHLLGLTGRPVLLADSTFQTLHTPPGETHYALGWLRTRFGELDASEHAGATGVFYAAMVLIPEQNLAMVFITNADPSSQETLATKVFSRLWHRYALAGDTP